MFKYVSYHKPINKKRIFALTLIITVFLSGFLFLNSFHASFDDSDIFHSDKNNILTSKTDLNINIEGSGNDEKVRVYLTNQSYNNNNTDGTFNISTPKEDTYLDYGDFLFNFNNSYTTNHTIENNKASNTDFNLSIDDNQKIALEFDIRGNNTKVHGFYAWIINSSKIQNTTKLNVSLYKSSESIPSRKSLSNVDPENVYPSTFIDSMVLLNYSSDQLEYFEFPNVKKLDYGNYFIVLSSNAITDFYNLIAIPNDEDVGGDGKNEHIFEIKEGTSAWQKPEYDFEGATYRDLDASSFTLNVTRAYFPSDFVVNNNRTLRIQNVPINDTKGESFPFIDADINQWGLGNWNAEFPTPILDSITDQFEVVLKWNVSGTGISDFLFNVSYTTLAYSEENSTAKYYADYNGDIKWILNYTIDLSLYGWNFTELWFIYPSYHNNESLLTPKTGSINVLEQTSGETSLKENPNLDKLIIPTNLSNINGEYKLNLSSYNALNQIHSYINFKGNLLETSGFMIGDNITMGADISGPQTSAPKKGTAFATLFNPDYSINDTTTESSGILSSNKALLTYDFDNETILSINNTVIFGTYYLGILWKNGSLIGINNIPIYIDYYNLNFGDFVVRDDINSFPLTNIPRFDDIEEDYSYNLFGASINKTNSFPQGFYAIKNENIDRKFIYQISGNNIELELNNFFQNESVLNPGENVNFRITLTNNQPILKVDDVKISIKLVSPINDDWIIWKNESISKSLEAAGHPNGYNQKDFNINLQIPNINSGLWEGYNSPIRLGGVKAIATIYIENESIYNYNSPDYSLLVNKTQNEFEGYILSLSNKPDVTSRGASIDISRENCIYSPNSTVILINIQDYNHLSSYQLLSNSYLLNTTSTFQTITTTPETPTTGKTFNLTSKLTTEFGNAISGVNIICEYYNGSIWKNIDDSPQISDAEGMTSFLIDTNDVCITENKIQFRLSWNGTENILKKTQEFNITLFSYSNKLSINAKIRKDPIYRNAPSLLEIVLNNNGNSNLNITSQNIILTFEDISPAYSIVQQDRSKLQFLQPEESSEVVIKIDFLTIPTDTLTINISITATNIDTQKTMISEESISVSVIDYPLFESFIDFFTLIMISIIGVVVALSLYYSYILKRRIETPVSKPEEKKRKRGAYKKVSELEKEEEKEEKKAGEEKTDLDSLLEEEGI